MSLEVNWKSFTCSKCGWTPYEGITQEEAEREVAIHSVAHIQIVKSEFTLTHEEVIALYDYFMRRAGYISYEFDPFIIVLIRRLRREVEKDKKI